MAYYHTCLDCGANLDPGESCDCHIAKSQIDDNAAISKALNQQKHRAESRKSETILIGFDFSDGRDVSVASVVRHRRGGIDVVNVISGEEAEQLYDYLMRKAGTIKI